MKKMKIVATLSCFVMLFLHSGCQKETVCASCTAANNPPIAAAGPDQVITLPVNTAVLNGQSSTDRDGSIRQWRWNKIAGPAGAIIEQPDSSLTRVSQLAAGTYQYELTVTDDKGISAKDTMRLLVDAVVTINHPPNAVAGADQVITLPLNTTSLDGSASTDPENNISSQLWTKISGPAAGTITNANMLLTSVTQLVAGVYSFELKVLDSGGLEGRDTVLVTVLPLANRPPNANAGPDQSLVLPVNAATLSGSASNDPDNNITGYLWTRISGPVSFNIRQASNVQTVVDQLSAGVHIFQLLVTDAGGLTGRDTVQVTVNGTPNLPPSAKAGADQVITLPVNTAFLNGQYSTDPESSILTYGWRQIAGSTQSTIPDPWLALCRVNNLSQGTYHFELTVTDQGGLLSKDTVKVTVVGTPTGSPAIFDNLFWMEGCDLQVPNIYSFIPAGAGLDVQVKVIDYQGQPSAWIPVRIQGSQVAGDFAYYLVENGNLKVRSILIDCNFDNSQSYSIKITY